MIRPEQSVMKILLRTNGYLLPILTATACLLIFACGSTDKTKHTAGKVEKQEKRIIIHPTVKLLPDEEKQLDDVLRKYDKKLYRIVTWKNGKVVKVRGYGPTTDAVIKPETTATPPLGFDWITEQSVCPNRFDCPTQNLPVNQKHLLDELGRVLANH
jgi:hypothetical protein